MKMLKRLGALLLVLAFVLSCVPALSLRAYADKLESGDKDPNDEVEDDFFDGVDRVVTGIEVGGTFKTEYLIGEALDLTGLEIVISYSDDSTKVVTDGYEVTGFDSATAGTKTLTVLCKGYATTFEVTVSEPVVATGIQITAPTKTEYEIGETLDLAGLVVNVTYSDSTSAVITEGYIITGFDSVTAGAKTVTVTYGEFTATFQVTVKESVVAAGICGTNVTWVLDTHGVLTISGTGAMADNYEGWMEYEGAIISVVIEPGVTAIGACAFFYNDSLISVTIPDSVTSIGEGAFVRCRNLKAITIPDSVKTIGNSAFYYCYSLTTITIPEGVTHIGDEAFRECTGLTSVTIPSSTLNIGNLAFLDCGRLTGIWVDVENHSYCSDSRGVLFNKDKTKLIQAPGGITGDYMIPDSVVEISSCAFSGCYDLNSVVIPNGVTTIGVSAFLQCYGLNTVIIPDSVTTIGISAFYNCQGLTSVVIESGATTIDEEAFAFCSSLSTITLPASVATIGWGAFYKCSSLTDVYYSGSQKQWNDIDIIDGNDELLNATIHYAVVETGITITAPTKNEYEIGEELDLAGLIVNVTYSNDTSAVITEGYTVTGFDSETAGVKTVTVTYGEFTATFEVTVKEPVPEVTMTGIEITTLPSKLTYTVGAALSTNGMVVSAIYDNGTKEALADGYTVSALDSATAGTKTITVTYGEFTATFEVQVVLNITLTLTVENAETGVALSWPAADGVDSYVIYRCQYTNGVAGEYAQIGETTDPAYVDTTALNGVRYGYAVSAKIGDSESEKSADASLYRLTPVTLTTENTNGGVTVKWTANAAATKYFIYRCELTDGEWTAWKQIKSHADLTKTLYTDTTAANGVMYRYCIRAVIGSTQFGPYTEGVQIMRLSIPSLSATNQATGIKLSWKKNTAAVTYDIYRSAYVDGTSTSWGKPIASVDASVLEYLDTTAENGVKYRYTVRVRNGEYISGYRDSAKLFRLEPTSVESIIENASGITITWVKNNAAAKYYVYRSEKAAGSSSWSSWTRVKITGSGSEVSYTDITAVKGNTYRYRITTVKDVDQSSARVSEYIMKLGNTAISLAAYANRTRVTIRENSMAKNYTIERRVSGGEWETIVANTTELVIWDETTVAGTTYEYRANANNGTYTCYGKAYSVVAK